MDRPIQRALLGLAGAALLGHWAMTGQPVGAAGRPPTQPTSYVVQAEANQPIAETRHGYFTLSLKAGQTKTVRIIIKNTGTRVLRISDYPADATQIAAGGIDFGTQHKQLTAVGTRITVRPKDLTLAPGEARRVSATITMPPGATPGDYVGGVAMENKAVQGQGAGSHVLIDVHYRQVIAIMDSVPGMRSTAAKIVGVALNPEPAGTQAVVSVRNTGNVLLKGNGAIALLGSKGAMQRYPFAVGTILPSAVAQIPLYLPNLLLRPGTYGMRVQLSSAHHLGLASWLGKVGFMLPTRLIPAAPIKNVLLQPAQGAPQQAGSQGSVQQAPATSSQTIPFVLFGAAAILVLMVGAGLGVVISRRPAPQHA